jgi:PPK2 family polyphosphate:nucleotide phosphotransferase
LAKKSSARLADYQYAGVARGQPEKKPARRDRFDLRRFDPAAKPFSLGDKAADKAAVEALAAEIDKLQDVLWADRRFKLLVVLQGTDTSGKDGTIRGVFGLTSALGVRAVGWKVPTEVERAHDCLWRIHQQVPGAGEIVIFNRSHFEDVLVPVVRGWITKAQTEQRFAQLNDFERMLTETGTVILKFFLHVSKEEQRQRLQERLDDPTKHWKFAIADLDERKRWDDYQAAYSAMIAATGTPWAPWTVVPADSKTHRNLMIATAVVDAMRALKLRYPPGDPALAGIKVP